MKNIFMPLIGIVLLEGCTKTIQVTSQQSVPQPRATVVVASTPVYEIERSQVERYPTNQPYVINEPQPQSEIERYPTNQPPYVVNEPQPQEEVLTAPAVIATTKPFNISPLEVHDRMLENPDILLLDVRTVQEIKSDGKIRNSTLIPLQVLNTQLNKLDRSKEIIVYCHTGNRSSVATKLLRSKGFDAINMKGGIQAWKASHLNVVWR